jgi:hypothetical protein
MQDLLLDAAQNLGVPPGSETMNRMLDYVEVTDEGSTLNSDDVEMEEAA